jgi:hypothetical protein
MLFKVDSDSGSAIRGYLVPDTFSAPAMISVCAGGEILCTVQAQEIVPAVVAAGRHQTGQIGFVIDERVVPGLVHIRALEICEAETGLAIYRRRPPGSPAVRLFRLEAGFRRMSSLDRSFDALFQTAFTGVDTYGRETASQALLLSSYESLYVSGRLLFKEYEYSLDEKFTKVIVVQDPYVQLAQTIVALHDGSLTGPTGFDLRTELSMHDCIDYFAAADIGNANSLRTLLVHMPDAVEAAISNPLARLLAGRPGEDVPNGSYIPTGLQSLASFDIVGLQADPTTFADPLAALLGTDSAQLMPDDITMPEIRLAERLREHRLVESMLELDLELYERVSRIVRDLADLSPSED